MSCCRYVVANRNWRNIISPIAGTTPLKPGSATLPFFGVNPIIVDNEGNELSGECEGNLCITTSWPGMMRTVYRNHKRFVETYFRLLKENILLATGARGIKTILLDNWKS